MAIFRPVNIRRRKGAIDLLAFSSSCSAGAHYKSPAGRIPYYGIHRLSKLFEAWCLVEQVRHRIRRCKFWLRMKFMLWTVEIWGHLNAKKRPKQKHVHAKIAHSSICMSLERADRIRLRFIRNEMLGSEFEARHLGVGTMWPRLADFHTQDRIRI